MPPQRSIIIIVMVAEEKGPFTAQRSDEADVENVPEIPPSIYSLSIDPAEQKYIIIIAVRDRILDGI